MIVPNKKRRRIPMFWPQIWFQVETFPGLHLSEEDKTVSRCPLQPIQ